MGELVNRLDYDRFHTIYILNKDLDIMGKITETDIISVADKCSTKIESEMCLNQSYDKVSIKAHN